jgi:Tol biopolymer transport system component
MNADGTNRQCLTCNDRIPKVLQGKHKGVSTMSPGGQYVVFFAENEHGGHRWMNTPGLGDDNDFWAMDADAKNFWRLTSNPAGSAIQFPKFSFDGKTFIWSERLEKGRPLRKGHEYGVWKIRMADFLVTPAGPRFGKIVDLEPAGKGYYEPHGLTPDGKKMLFTAMVNPNKSQYYGELYSYDLASRQLINLAKADDLHFEMAIATPGGSKISFMSGPFIGMLRFFYKTDLYLMDADGLNRVRLTYFNEVGHPESTGEDTLMNKHAWKPDGTAIAGAYYIHKTKEISLFLLTFQGACGKR